MPSANIGGGVFKPSLKSPLDVILRRNMITNTNQISKTHIIDTQFVYL